MKVSWILSALTVVYFHALGPEPGDGCRHETLRGFAALLGRLEDPVQPDHRFHNHMASSLTDY